MRARQLTVLVSILVLSACADEADVRTEATPADPAASDAFSNGMASTAHPVATEAGLEILAAGGNAFDAAVAIASTLNVVEPMMSGMGGYGTIMVYSAADAAPYYLDASGKIPVGVDPDVYRAPTPNYMENRVGPKAVSTPGASRAWQAMHDRFGSMEWSALLQPAIRAADDGHIVDDRIARLIEYSFEEFGDYPRSIFGRNGEPLGAGDRLVQADLANTLRLLAEEGTDAIYGGELGRAIDTAMGESGGFLAMTDLESHNADWWQPLHLEFRGHDVYTPSAPAGAFPMLERLGMMDRAGSRELGHNTLEYLHTFAELTKAAYWDRLAFSSDPDIARPPYERLFSPDYWQSRVDAIDPGAAKDFDYAGIVSANSENTTHFVVADREGNIVSATVTLGVLYSSKIMPSGTGFFLNNSLRYCTFEPAGNPMDAHPGRRKLSSDSPAIILKDGRPVYALGTPGGHTITQAVAQMTMNLLDHGMTIDEAISAPRIAFIEPNTLAVEETIEESVRQSLIDMGHDVQVRGIGNANGLAIEYLEDGTVRFSGASDPRGAGLAKGY